MNTILAPKDANMNEPFFKSSYVLRGGRGGKGMLKLQIDRRITDKKPNATCLNLLGLLMFGCKICLVRVFSGILREKNETPFGTGKMKKTTITNQPAITT